LSEAPAPDDAGTATSGRRWLILLARAALTCAVLGALVWFVSVETLVATMRRAPLGLWLGVVAGLIVGHLVAAMKWRLFLSAAGTPCSPVEALRAHGAGLFANLCLPSLVGGDVVRAGMLARARSVAALAVGSIADRIVDTAVLVTLASVGAALAPGVLPGSAVGLLVGIAAVLGAVAVLGPPLLRRLAPLAPAKARGFADKLAAAANAFSARPGAALVGFALSLAVQSAFVLLNAGLGRAIGIDVPLAVWFLCWPLAKLIALAPISLGGLGVREAALAGLLGLFGVGADLAVGQSLLWQAALITLGLLSGALAFGSGRFTRPLEPTAGDTAGGAA
jgi:uncharacterized membrane protein YbhN (UPF0104 family)